MSDKIVIYEWQEDMLSNGEYELHADGVFVGRVYEEKNLGASTYWYKDATVLTLTRLQARSVVEAQAAYISIVENRPTIAPKRGETIAAMFADYKAQVISPTAPEVQVREVELAFWAGAMSLYRSVMLNLSPGPDATTGDLQYMIQLEAEIQAYGIRSRKIADSQPGGKQ